MTTHPLAHLSPTARVTLDQLALGAVRDGDLVSKQGRNELVAAGLAKRQTRFADGQMRNELTERGKYLLATSKLGAAQAYAKLYRSLEANVRPIAASAAPKQQAQRDTR